MAAEVNVLQTKLQDVVKFVGDVPDTVAELQAKLDSISNWCSASHLDAMPITVGMIETTLAEFSSQTGRRL